MSINVYSSRVVQGYGPDLPIKKDNTLELIHGPEYSINMNFMLFYLQNIRGATSNSYLCYDIINYVLDVTVIVINAHDPNYDNHYHRLVNINDERYILLKLHILEAITCFKYAIEAKYPISYSSYNSSVEGRYYDILDKIFDLFFIDMSEVQDFIIYYLELIHAINDDKKAIEYLVKNMINKCINPNGFNTLVFKRMLESLKIANISIEQFYYNSINSELDDIYHIPVVTDYICLIQIGIDYGFKLNKAEIKYINNIDNFNGRQLYLKPDISNNLYYYKILPKCIIKNCDEWHQLQRIDIALASKVKARFITNENIAQNGNSIVNRNLSKLADFIANYC